MKALVLAAGYAVRLYPLTKNYPKPLLEVNKRPIIDYIIDKLKNIAEIDEIIIVTNSKFYPLFKKWAKKLACPKRVSVIDDRTATPETRRGAIGDMDFSLQAKRVKDSVLVIGGDNIFEDSLEEFLRFARAKAAHPVIGVYDIKKKSLSRNYGVVRVNKVKRIIDFQEKPKHPASSLVAMCLYYFPKSKLKLIGEYLRRHKNDAMGFYINWLRKRQAVYAFVFRRQWYDIGDKNFYNQAKQNIKLGG